MGIAVIVIIRNTFMAIASTKIEATTTTIITNLLIVSHFRFNLSTNFDFIFKNQLFDGITKHLLVRYKVCCACNLILPTL